MRTFRYDSFAKLSQAFTSKTNQTRVKQIWQSYLRNPKETIKGIIEHAVEGIHADLPISAFTKAASSRPFIKSRFIKAAQPKEQKIELQPIKSLGSLEKSRFVVSLSQTKSLKKEQKKRKTLKLKKTVELPPIQSLTRDSSIKDLAAIFKSELKTIKNKKAANVNELSALTHSFKQKRRVHPSAQKSWSELLADVERPKEKRNFDLAAAFKAEMETLLTQQKRLGDDFMAAPKPLPFKRKKLVPQTIMPRYRATSRFKGLAA